MKKYILSFSLIVAFAFYIAINNQNTLTVSSPLAANVGSPGSTGTANGAGTGTNAPAGGTKPVRIIGDDEGGDEGGSAPAPAPTPASTPTPSTQTLAQTGAYKNGTYTGSVADAFYGNVQVQAVVTNGQLSNVNVLQYPSDRGTSREINGIAMPELVQEAIQAQGANVNIISGATQSSEAFQQSLADALAQAKA